MPAIQIKGHEVENENSKIWRYMDFTKFLDILIHKSLFISNINKFNDPYEGIFPKKIYDKLIVEEPFKIIEPIRKLFEDQKKFTYINCWHMSEYESAAMWSIYGKYDKSIAIQTTYDKLKNTLSDTIKIGKVNYSENPKYENSITPEYASFHKRSSFEYEKEIRLYLYDNSKANENGIRIPIDNLEQLIDVVYISPDASEEFVSLIKNLLDKLNINIKVEHSNLYTNPYLR